MKKLFDAIERQDVDGVRTLVASPKFDPHSTERHSAGYMLMAAQAGSVEIGEILKDAGVPITLEDTDAMDLDVLDYGKANPDFLAFLAKNGINLGRTKAEAFNGKREHTLIGACIMCGHVATVEFLLSNGVRPTQDDVSYARKMLEHQSGHIPTSQHQETAYLTELALSMRGGPTKKERNDHINPYQRIVALLEQATAQEQKLPSLKDADPRFRKGPQGKVKQPKKLKR